MDPDRPDSLPIPALDRRRFLALASALGAAAVPGALLGEEAKAGGLTAKTLAEAEKVTGLSFTEEERALMLKGLDDLQEDYAKLHAVHLENSVPPALRFDPVVPGAVPGGASSFHPSAVSA